MASADSVSYAKDRRFLTTCRLSKSHFTGCTFSRSRASCEPLLLPLYRRNMLANLVEGFPSRAHSCDVSTCLWMPTHVWTSWSSLFRGGRISLESCRHAVAAVWDHASAVRVRPHRTGRLVVGWILLGFSSPALPSRKIGRA